MNGNHARAVSPNDFKGRVHIIGGPGTGKSTIAHRLGKLLALPVYDLDKIAFEGKEFRPRSPAAKQADVARIAGQPAWITEGIFLGWTDELLEKADVILWIDHLTWPVAAYRIVRRFLMGGIAEAKRQRGIRKVSRFGDYAEHSRQLWHVLASTRCYYTSSLAHGPGALRESRCATLQTLVPYSDKVIRCRSQSEIDAVLAEFAGRKSDSRLIPA